jgi:hypothetical protein
VAETRLAHAVSADNLGDDERANLPAMWEHLVPASVCGYEHNLRRRGRTPVSPGRGWFPGIFARGAHLLEIAWRNLATTTIKDSSSTKPFCPNFSFFFALALDWITRELAGNVLLV